MSATVVIVDPVSSGSELAPAFASRGVASIAVRSTAEADSADVGYTRGIDVRDFIAVFDDTADLVEQLRQRAPLAVIAGSESGVALADRLASVLTPNRANVSECASARRHKAHMQRALAAAGLPTIRTLDTSSFAEVEHWLAHERLVGRAIVVKPPASAGSDMVFHVQAGSDWRPHFEHILATPTSLLGEVSATVVVQEMIRGVEYAVDTVSAEGRHALAHLIRYSKTSAGDRCTVFDHTEFVDRDDGLVSFAERVLDALGIRWGAAHSEIMMTEDGPRLIETGARMCGGPVLAFARAATGSSQLERVIEAYVDGMIATTGYHLERTVVPVFLKAPHAGVLRNVEVLQPLEALPTHLASKLWLRNGDRVRRTVDFDSTLGIVALAGEREAVFADYHHVRAAEARLIIEESRDHDEAFRTGDRAQP